MRVFCSSLLIALALAPAALRADRLEITYLGNEGFLLTDGEHTVLVDALFGEGLDGYPTVDPAIRGSMEAAEPPYDAVDIVLATHHHRDHFDPHAVARHLRNNPRAVFLSTPQAITKMRSEVEGFAALEPRAHGILPEEGTRHSVRLVGLDIELLNLHHGRSRVPTVENLGFLFELGGSLLLHVGDTVATKEEFASLNLKEQGIDIAFLPSWLVAYDDWAGVASEGVGADELIVMHLPVPDAPDQFFAPFAGFNGLLEEIESRHPTARLFYSGSIDRTEISQPQRTPPRNPQQAAPGSSENPS